MKHYIAAFFILFSARASYAGETYPLIHAQQYLQSSGPLHFPLILSNKKGEAVLTLDAEGLTYRGKPLCYWTESDSSAAISYTVEKSYSLVFNADCPKDSPLLALWSDHGVGTAALFVRAMSSNATVVATDFRGETLTLPRAAIKDFQLYRYNQDERPM